MFTISEIIRVRSEMFHIRMVKNGENSEIRKLSDIHDDEHINENTT